MSTSPGCPRSWTKPEPSGRVSPSKVAWQVHLDVYILAADGALLDAVLLAAVACLSTLHLPAVPLTPQGTVSRQATEPSLCPQDTVAEKASACRWHVTGR